METQYTYSFQSNEEGYAADGSWSEYIDRDESVTEQRYYYNGEYSYRIEMIVKNEMNNIVLILTYTKIILYHPDFGSDKIHFEINEDINRVDLYSTKLQSRKMVKYWLSQLNDKCQSHVDENHEVYKYYKIPKILCKTCKKEIYPPDISLANDTTIEEFYDDQCKQCIIDVEKNKKIKEIEDKISKLQEELMIIKNNFIQ